LKSLVFRGDPNSPMNEMPISQLKCLHIVRDTEGQKMIDIAHRMEIGLPAASQIVDRLVRRGLLERKADTQDRRVVRVGLTETSRSILAEAEQHRQMRMDATLAHLDLPNIVKATRGLHLLAEAAERVEALEKASQTSSVLGERQEEPVRVGDPLVDLISERARTRRKRSQPELLPEAQPARP
jgi:DNA-binding MarR family transcriptional regulator